MKSSKPRFRYFLSQANSPVQENGKIWNASLPMHRGRPGKQLRKADGISYGDYFSAARSFLKKNRYQLISSVAAAYFKREIKQKDIQEIHVFLEKHGEFYHPARIEMAVRNLKILFVLNVAISDSGRKYIDKEYRTLQRLNAGSSLSFLPRVYGLGEAVLKTGTDDEIRMFLGEWLEGYQEFHLSHDPTDGKTKIAVWDTDKGKFFLEKRETVELYKYAAKILTWYYNVETFEQIFPWHHAAGDFIIKIQKNKLDMKLVTVRQYASMFEGEWEDKDRDQDAALILEALLIFFLKLSIRMRLDRIDGVGDVIWSDDTAVEGTVEGFFQGMTLKCRHGMVSESNADFFKAYLLSCTKRSLHDLSEAIIKTYNPDAPDRPVIKRNLKRHIELLHRAINNKRLISR